jgi:hypothetical protein
MLSKLVILTAALIMCGPVFASVGGGSGGGSAPSSGGGGGGGHGGGGGGGGGHGGGGAGGGGGHGGGSLGGHGASHAIAATGGHVGVGGGHTAHDSAGKHVQSEHSTRSENSTSRVAGMHHHHPLGPHHVRDRGEGVAWQWPHRDCLGRQYVEKWVDCNGAAKSHPLNPANRS